MYCPHCGAENEGDRPLCFRCGTSLRRLEPVQPRVAALRGQSRFLTMLGLLLAAGVGVLAVILALLFALTPDPRPLPAATPSPLAPVAAAPTATPRPAPTPEPALPAGLTGRIIDSSTALPVAGALVVAGSGQATTDDTGRYTIEGLLPGQLVVAVACAGYEGGRSAIVSVAGGEVRNVDIALSRPGQSEEPVDPLLGQAMDPGGAPTEEDAERLARLQGLAGEVTAIEPVTLRGIYWVNCRSEGGTGATMVALDHQGWALADREGRRWRIVKDCGALAVPVPAGWVAPQPPATSRSGHEPPSSGEASPAQEQAETAALPDAAASYLPQVHWSEPQLIGGEGQGGPTQQLLLDREGRLWAFWEEHATPGTEGKGYTAVHYRVWQGDAWGDLHDIPGSEGFGEPAAAQLPDGDILVKAEPIADGIHPWFRWDGYTWSTVAEMAWQQPQGDPIRGVAADGWGTVHLIGYPIYTWDENRWHKGEKLGTIYYYATALDANGQLHAVGRPLPLSEPKNIVRWVWEGQAWSAPMTIYSFPTVGSLGPGIVSLDIGPAGDFHIAWDCSCPLPAQGGMASCVCYGHGDGTQWSEPDVLFGPIELDVGFLGPDVAVTPDGTVFVTWGDVKFKGEPQAGPYRVYVTWGRGHEWAEPLVLSPLDGYEHHWATVGVDAAGRAHVIWKGQAGVYHAMATIGE